jgi:hypothetical protein
MNELDLGELFCRELAERESRLKKAYLDDEYSLTDVWVFTDFGRDSASNIFLKTGGNYSGSGFPRILSIGC